MATIIEISTRSGIRFKDVVGREGKTLTKRFVRKTDAREWAHEQEAKIRSGALMPLLKKHSFFEAVERYIS